MVVPVDLPFLLFLIWTGTTLAGLYVTYVAFELITSRARHLSITDLDRLYQLAFALCVIVTIAGLAIISINCARFN